MGRAAISLHGGDNALSRGFVGVGALLAGMMFIVFGLLGAFGVADLR